MKNIKRTSFPIKDFPKEKILKSGKVENKNLARFIKHTKMAERLSLINKVSKRQEVIFRLKVIEYHDRYGTSATVSA